MYIDGIIARPLQYAFIKPYHSGPTTMTFQILSIILKQFIRLLLSPGGAPFITRVSVYLSAQKGCWFKLFCTTHTYATQIIIRGYVHVWRTFAKYILFVLVW